MAAISLTKNGNPSNNKHKIENGLYITRVLLKALVLTHQKTFNPIYFGEPMFTIFSSKFLKYSCSMTYCCFRCHFYLFLIGPEISFPYLKKPFINSWKKYINIYLQKRERYISICVYIWYLMDGKCFVIDKISDAYLFPLPFSISFHLFLESKKSLQFTNRYLKLMFQTYWINAE